MSNINVKTKNIRRKRIPPSFWEGLAEDAEREIEKAQQRIKHLADAARIFRQNAAHGLPFSGGRRPSETGASTQAE